MNPFVKAVIIAAVHEILRQAAKPKNKKRNSKYKPNRKGTNDERR
jgi:hypothetical protein